MQAFTENEDLTAQQMAVFDSALQSSPRSTKDLLIPSAMQTDVVSRSNGVTEAERPVKVAFSSTEQAAAKAAPAETSPSRCTAYVSQ